MKITHFVFLLAALTVACRKQKVEKEEVLPPTSNCFSTEIINTSITTNIFAVHFVDARVGYLGDAQGNVYKTTDSANTWIRISTVLNQPISDLYFLNANVGFAVGRENGCYGPVCIYKGGVILKTADGGQSWNIVHTPSATVELRDIIFISEKIGLCISGKTIYRSKDGGATWTEMQMTELNAAMTAMSFSDNLNGYISCTGNKVLTTSDGGESWKIKTLDFSLPKYTVSVAGSNAYLYGQNQLIKSSDKGKTWSEITGAPTTLNDIYFTSANTGFGVGKGDYTGGDWGVYYASIYCTTDGGKTWEGRRDYNEIGGLKKVVFPEAKLGYAIGGSKIIRIRVN